MGILWQDIRYGLRMLMKNPGFTAVAVITLGLGLGINTAIFSFLDGALLRPLPVKRPHELVVVGYRSARNKNVETYGDFHYPLYTSYRDQAQVFSGLIACAAWGDLMDLTVGDFSGRVIGVGVSGNYFSVLGVKPFLGRMFLAEEDDAPGAPAVAVISHRLWQRRFACDPAVLGRMIRVDGRPVTIIGVTPPGFTGTAAGVGTAVYVPLHTWAYMNGFPVDDRGRTWLLLLGRLKPGATRRQAQANLQVLTEQIRTVEPENTPLEVVLSDGSQGYNLWRDEGLSWALALFQVPAALILLIACANVTNMVLARATTRQKEIAIRLGIGASRGAVIRQLLCESILLALLSGACGVLLAQWLSSILRSMLIVASGLDMSADVGGRVLAFTLVVSLAAAVASSLAPALRASQPNVISLLKDSPGVIEVLSRRWSLRNLLVVIQVAISLIVLVFGALCVRSLRKLQAIDAGFDPTRILAVSVDLDNHDALRTGIRPFFDELSARVAEWPGVQAVSLASGAPLSATGKQRTGVKQVEGFQFPPDRDPDSVDYDAVSPGYFSMLRVPLLRGRHFGAQDGPGSTPVMIVNEAFAQRYWPNQDPIGKRVTCGRGEVREVVGVVKTARLWSLRESPGPTMYWPLAQSPQTQPVLLIRTEAAPGALVPPMRQALAPLGLNPPDCDIRTIDEHISDVLSGQRMIGVILNVLGLLGLAFAATGIAGVMAYEVSRRTREIGIRMALGARCGSVLGLVVRKGMTLTVVGLSVGAAVSLVPAWLLCTLLPELHESSDYLLYGVRLWDPVTYAAVSLLLAGVALAACYLPARRVTRVDPMVALRYE